MGDYIAQNAWLLSAVLVVAGAGAAFMHLGTPAAAAGVLLGFVLIWKSEHVVGSNG